MTKAIVLVGITALLLAGCNLPSTNKFNYVGVHVCDPLRTIPLPSEGALCLFEEDK